jgi:teichuronic acid biosynthesis glycosyltransferase TuaC
MRVLYVTAEWPTEEYPVAGAYLVRQVTYLRRAGVEIDVFPFRGRRDPARYWRIYRQLQHAIKHGSYDLAHAQFGHSGFLVSLPKRLPLVVTYHGSDLVGFYSQRGRYGYISPLFRRAMWFVAWRADEVILVAHHLARYLRRKDFHIIPCGVDLEMFKPLPQQEAREKLALPPDKKLVVFVGNIHRSVKRFDLAQAVMQELARQWPTMDAELIPVFDVAHETVPLYMNAADALLLTSHHEGSPTVIKEAMACNLPIVSTDVGDVRERLKNVTGCAVVPTNEAADLASQLGNVLQQGQRTNGWLAAQELDEARLAQCHLDVYQAAIKKHNGR